MRDFSGLVEQNSNSSESRDFSELAEQNAKQLENRDFSSLAEAGLSPPLSKDIKLPAQSGFTERVKDYFKQNKFGEALRLQQKSGGFAGAPQLSPEQAKKVGTEVGTIAAVEAAFIPVLGAAQAVKYAPRVMTAIARLTQAGTTGAAVATTSKLVEGELPSKEELLENGLQWAAIDAIMQGTHIAIAGGKQAFNFGRAVSSIAEKEGIPKTQVLSKLWDSTKGYIRTKFGKNIVSPADITPQDVEIFAEQVNEAEKKDVQQIEQKVTPKEPPKPPLVPEIKIQPVEEEVKPAIKPKPAVGDDIESVENNLRRLEKEQQEFIRSDKYQQSEQGYEQTEKAFEIAIAANKKLLEKLDAEAEEMPIVNKGDQRSLIAAEYTKKNINPSEKQIDSVIQAIDTGEVAPNGALMFPSNKASTKAFEAVTGEKLPTTQKGRKQYFDERKARLSAKKVPPKEKPQKPLAAPLQKKPTQTSKAETRQPIMGNAQAKKRSEILNLFRRAFKDPIRLQKFRQRASGIHKMWPKVSRLLHDNNIETAAHEIGHNLHTILFGGSAKTPTEQGINISRALHPYLAELKPLAHYEPWGMEGFAEFTRMYVTNASAAKRLTPKFYDFFEHTLNAEYPELKTALITARDYYEQYLTAAPEERVKAQIVFADDVEDLVVVKDPTKRDKIKTALLDDLYPLKKMVADLFDIKPVEVEQLISDVNVYRSARVFKGAIGKAEVFLMHETFDPKTLKKTGEGLVPILEGLSKEDMKNLSAYLVAKRSLEKAGQGFRTGISSIDAQATVTKYEKQFGSIAQRINDYFDRVFQYYKDAGMASQESYDLMKSMNKFYVKFTRILHPENVKKKGIGTKSLEAKQKVKRFKGSDADIQDPLLSAVEQTYVLINEAEKNLLGQQMAKLAEMKGAASYIERVPTSMIPQYKISQEQIIDRIISEHTMPDGSVLLSDAEIKKLEQLIPKQLEKWRPVKPSGNIITVYQEGKPTYYETSPEIHELWTKGLSPYNANLITKILAYPARILRAGAVLNPRFILKNPVRDTFERAYFTQAGKGKDLLTGKEILNMFYEPLAGLAAAAKKSELYVEWLKSGGGMATMQSIDREGLQKKLDMLRHGLKPHQIIGWLRKAAELTEEANRLAEFARVLSVQADTRIGREAAAFASRDISIDFAKMGTLIHALNQVIPFFNARVQGIDKLARTAYNKNTRAEFLRRAAIFIVLPSLFSALLMRGRKEAEEQPETTKDLNFLFPWFGMDMLNIPVGFEAGIIFHGLTRRFVNYALDKDPHAFDGYLQSAISGALPDFLPTAFKPFIEAWANKDFYTKRRIIPQGKENLYAELQYNNYTSLTARMAGRAISYIVGPENLSSYGSPAIIDHFIKSWTGGLGQLTTKFLDEGMKLAGKGDEIPSPDVPITDMIGFNAFVTRFPRAGSKSVETFYDNYKETQKATRTARIVPKSEAERFKSSYIGSNNMLMKNSYQAMQKSQKAISQIYKNPDIDSKEKREMIDKMYLHQIDFARRVNEQYEKNKKSQN